MVRWARSPQDAVLVLVATARELGHDPERLTPRQCLDTWAATAHVPFRVPRDAEADGLFYGFGVEEGTFRLELVRRFACRDADEHCVVRYDVRLPATPELEALGRHGEWCFEAPASPARRAWTAALAERPEWALLAGTADAEVELTADCA